MLQFIFSHPKFNLIWIVEISKEYRVAFSAEAKSCCVLCWNWKFNEENIFPRNVVSSIKFKQGYGGGMNDEKKRKKTETWNE